MAAARTGTDDWSLFLRQRRLKDQLRRLRNDFKDCHCPPDCRGGLQSHVGVYPVPPPAQPLHGPYVRPDSDMPITTSRPEERRDSECTVLAEARGTSDILLYRKGTRATLRMSLQVHTDVIESGRVGYFAEMFLTETGQEEEFIGFIKSWHVERRTNEWEYMMMDEYDFRDGDIADMRKFMRDLYGTMLEDDDIPRDQNGNLVPLEEVQSLFAAPWAMLGDNSDILYIPTIWITARVRANLHSSLTIKPQHSGDYICKFLTKSVTQHTRQRIIDQGFELFFRLMTGGTLPEQYNLTRPLSVLLEPGLLSGRYANEWRDQDTSRMDMVTQVDLIRRAYVRNGFMRLNPDTLAMGRRVEPGDHPAAPGDVNMDPPDPPDTDLNTPSPRHRRLPRAISTSSSLSPESPSQWTAMGPGAQRERLPAWLLERRRRGK